MDKKKLKGAFFLIDFEKAFDSVDHQFIFDIMEKLGFPSEFIKWTKLGFTSTQASLIINGKLTSFFDLPGGGRQGDNLFPLIFAIVVQGLASLINKSDAAGIRVGDKYHKIVQYADDSTLLVSEDSDWAIYNTCITIFCEASGMVINWSKSKGLWLGSWITIPQKIKPLGCHPMYTQCYNLSRTENLKEC